MIWLKICQLPKGVKWPHIYGVGILAGIGFTMSLFITELAFNDENYMVQAKIGILSASLLAGLLGYFYLKFISRIRKQKAKKSTVAARKEAFKKLEVI